METELLFQIESGTHMRELYQSFTAFANTFFISGGLMMKGLPASILG
ncbi:hypothetical protein D2M30_3889 [Bacillus amyloliquefaciens]|nr:hypothetical protein D2M30_3889 [Bacillus amyloliquefaciens]